MRVTSASGKGEMRPIERTSQVPLIRDTMKASGGVNGKSMSSSMGLRRTGIDPAGIRGSGSERGVGEKAAAMVSAAGAGGGALTAGPRAGGGPGRAGLSGLVGFTLGG